MFNYCRIFFKGGIVCFTMNAAQFDSAHNSYRLKCEQLVNNGKWKPISQGITCHELEGRKDNNNKYDEDCYVLVFMVIDN